jgi:hypothetical protein
MLLKGLLEGLGGALKEPFSGRASECLPKLLQTPIYHPLQQFSPSYIPDSFPSTPSTTLSTFQPLQPSTPSTSNLQLLQQFSTPSTPLTPLSRKGDDFNK